MKKPVNIVHYDMADFLDSCVESYCELAKTSRATLKKVLTPFHELRTALPREGEKEPTGRLQPIASRVLMKILFAAQWRDMIFFVQLSLLLHVLQSGPKFVMRACIVWLLKLDPQSQNVVLYWG